LELSQAQVVDQAIFLNSCIWSQYLDLTSEIVENNISHDHDGDDDGDHAVAERFEPAAIHPEKRRQ
jgi:hypothetical protein